MRPVTLVPALLVALSVLCYPSVSQADPVTFSDSSGTLAASVTFEVINTNQLKVTLTNTSTNDALVPVDILTAVFFNIAGNPTLGTVSATLAAGSSVLFPPPPPGGADEGPDLGPEWAYKSNTAGLGQGSGLPANAVTQVYGISSSGFGLFGPTDRFNTSTDYQSPADPDGLQYGITSAGDNPGTGNAPVTGNNALIKNSVEFVLSGLPAGFDPLAAISDVRFQYGTSLNEPYFEPPEPGPTGAPVPPSVLLLGIGGLGWAGTYRFRRRKA